MNARRGLLVAAALVALGLGWWAWGLAGYSPPVVGPAAAPDDEVWRGVVHVHSDRSDGDGSVEEIAAAAAAAGLDFVVLTDHSIDLLDEPRLHSEWFGDVLVVAAEEVSTEEGHLLALGVRPHRYALAPVAAEALVDIAELGGWGLVAHPAHPGTPWRGGWGMVQGLEAYNLAEFWDRAGPARRIGVVAAFPFSPARAALRLLAEAPPALATFDRLTALPGGPDPPRGIARPLVAVGGSDAHGPKVGLGPLRFPGYRESFETVQVMLWARREPRPGEQGSRHQADRLLEALRAGRVATELTAAGRAPAPTWRAEASGREPVVAGGWAPWRAGPWTLTASLGAAGDYRLVLLRDGAAVASAEGGDLAYRVDEPGTYRLEAWRTGGPPGAGRVGAVPWILFNPIYVWPWEQWASARRYLVPPVPAPPPSRELAREGSWTAEGSADVESGTAPTGPPSPPVWTLTLPESGGDDTFAALAWRPGAPEDWSLADGLAVRLRADRTTRMRLELRLRDPSGEESRWQASVKATPEGRSAGIPWDRWRPAREREPDDYSIGALGGTSGTGSGSGTTLGSRELGEVRGLFLVVTPKLLRPGSAARVTLESIGPYGPPR